MRVMALLDLSSSAIAPMAACLLPMGFPTADHSTKIGTARVSPSLPNARSDASRSVSSGETDFTAAASVSNALGAWILASAPSAAVRTRYAASLAATPAVASEADSCPVM